MGFFSWRSCVSGHDIMNNYASDGLYDGMAIILPNNTIISGEYNGYGCIIDEEGVKHDVYALMSKLMFGIEDRDLVFGTIKRFSKDGEQCFVVDKFNYADPILKDEVKEVSEGFDINTIIGKSMNDVNELGFTTRTAFDEANEMIKVMLRSEVKEEMKYDELPVSERAEGQGHWFSSYESRVSHWEFNEEGDYENI
jgi:hypothetical protein